MVAELIGSLPDEILFTSCATESNNSAIQAALAVDPRKRHIITSATEHSSVLAHCDALGANGYRVTYLPVDCDGMLNLESLKDSMSADTAVVSLHWANNETGVVFPVREIAEFCQEHGVIFHCDAVQAAGKTEINLRETPINFVSISGHKFFAPKGVGALYVRRDTPFEPFLFGGHQEGGRRGGTENVALIVGMGRAAELAKARLSDFGHFVGTLRDDLETRILAEIPNTELNGHPNLRLDNTTNIAFHGVESDGLLAFLDQSGVCASKGSACLGNTDGPSHVIKAMKPKGIISRQSLRFSLGFQTTKADIDTCLSALKKGVALLRA